MIAPHEMAHVYDEAKEIRLGTAIAAGAAAGVIAGIVMALIAMIGADSVGMGFWQPMEDVAATWYGADAATAGSGVLAVGVATHLLTAAAWGAFFGFLARRRRAIGVDLLIGLGIGIVAWAVMTFAVLPVLAETLAARIDAQGGWFWFAIHLAYGGVLGLLQPGFVRLFTDAGEERRSRRREERYPPGEPLAP